MASWCNSSDCLAPETGEVWMIFHATRWCGTRQQGWKILQWLEVEVFSSIVGIVYLGLLVALFMIWLGSMHIRSFRFGFSLTRMFESQSGGCATGFMMPSLQSLPNSSFTLFSFPMGPWELDALGRTQAWYWDLARCAWWFLEGFHALVWIRSSSIVVHRSSSAFLVVELVAGYGKFFLQLHVPSRQHTPSSNLGPVHHFHWEALVSHLECLPQGNLWCESCSFSRSIRSPGLQDA